MNVLYIAGVSLFAVVGLLLVALVLIQKGNASRTLFGGAGGGSVLGHRLPTALTWATAGTFALFILLAVALHRFGS